MLSVSTACFHFVTCQIKDWWRMIEARNQLSPSVVNPSRMALVRFMSDGPQVLTALVTGDYG